MAWRRAFRVVILAAVGALAVALMLPDRRGARALGREEEFDASELSALEGRVSAEALDAALRIIDPWQQLAPFISVEGAEIRLQLTPERVVRVGLVGNTASQRSAEERPPGVATTASLLESRSLPARGPLGGLRIVLDPGHYGGSWSELEQRHFSYAGYTPIREGDLTHATALLLRDRLRAAGAEVLLTRGAPPTEPFEASRFPDFDSDAQAALLLGEALAGAGDLWTKLLPSRLAVWVLEHRKDTWRRERVFELFNQHDLRRRAALARDFRPHLTLSIHYNLIANDENGIIVFVPGHCMKGELDTAPARYLALRRALEGRLDATTEVARAISRGMQHHLDLPPLSRVPTSADGIAKKGPVAPEEGVFARNLAILKRTPGVVLLLEGPSMSAAPEIPLLARSEGRIEGLPYPARARQYADGVLQGVVEVAPLLRATGPSH